MVDLPSDFWAGWIVVVTIVSGVGLCWLVYSVYFGKNADASVAHEVWDESLREGTAAAPLWWFWLIVALLAVSVVYLILYPGLGSYRGALQWSQGGRFADSAARYDAEFGAARAQIAAADVGALRADETMLRSAESVFRNNCAACHGEDLRGQANTFPNLTDREWQWGGETAQIELSIMAGRQAVMPPWQAALGDAGVAAVADYVISLSRVQRGRVGLAEGKRLFDLYCVACHGADGGGNPALGAPPLNDGSWTYGGDTLEVRDTIANGRNGVMPPFAARLEPAQIKMLVALLEQQHAAATK
jgi:cytochrome c oxidase cbb3-type subunit 3